MTQILRRGRGVRHSENRVFSERRDTDVLIESTTDRKRVAARLDKSRSFVDRVLEHVDRSPITTVRLWLSANLETAEPAIALAGLAYLNDYFEAELAAANGKSRGERVDLIHGGAEVMTAVGGLLEEVSVALRGDLLVSDSERQRIERWVRKVEDKLAEIRRSTAASNERWHQEHDAKPAGPTPIRGSRHRASGERRA